jgi:hypothetical protein
VDEGFDNQNDILFFILINISHRSAHKKSLFIDVGDPVPQIPSINARVWNLLSIVESDQSLFKPIG